MIIRNWILQNFPFVEDDFDALTDYELFCKMIEFASNPDNIKDELKAYINEEISKIALDGTYTPSNETLSLSIVTGGENNA